MDESANGSYVAVILKMSRDWYNMLFGFQKIEADKKEKDLKWQNTETMIILTTKKMQLNFFLHGREKPTTHEQ